MSLAVGLIVSAPYGYRRANISDPAPQTAERLIEWRKISLLWWEGGGGGEINKQIDIRINK